MVRGRQNTKNSSTLDINCGKSIYFIILKFFVAIDTCLGHAKHILHCIYHTNSRNAGKPRNQSFKGERVNKMAKNGSNFGSRPTFSRGPHISEIHG